MSLNTPKRALVVGGTSGIGQGIALALARRGVQVTVVGRSAERGDAVVQQLSAISSSNKTVHAFQPMDGFDLKSVREVALQSKKIDFLVLTQGMATLQGYTPTVDGIDQKLQLHYFSRFYMARLLAPHMAEDSRVLTVLSAGVHGKYQKFESGFDLQKNYSVKNAADAAGFYTDAGFERLAQDHPNLIIAHAAPGFVNTNWGTEMPWFVRAAIRPLQSLFGRSLDDCGEFMAKGCLELSSPGFYLLDRDGKTIQGGIKHTPEERNVIWEKTLEILPDL